MKPEQGKSSGLRTESGVTDPHDESPEPTPTTKAPTRAT